MKKLLFVLFSSMFLMACSSANWSGKDMATEVKGNTYVLEGTVGDSEITLTFGEDQISGSAGVNRYFAPYMIDGDNLSVQAVGTTRMMGPEDLMKQEMDYTASLQEAEKIAMEGGKLKITTNKGRVLTFTQKEMSMEEKLVGRTFNLEGAMEEFPITLNFAEDRISGKSGVNNYSAGYELDGKRLSISPQIISTMMAGPEEVMQQESEYLSNLSQADSVEFVGETLEIKLTTGKKLIFK